MISKQILLAESDPKQLRLLRVSLEHEGYEVLVAEDGRSALEYLDEGGIDLLLCATSLNRLDGFELVEEIQARDELRAMPIVLMIDGDARAERLRGVGLGVEEFLTKPVFVKEMLARVQVLLARQVRDRLSLSSVGASIEGTLRDMTVHDLLESLEKGRQSGIVTVRSDGRDAVVHFRDGAILDASVLKLRGEEAVFRLMTWDRGRYQVTLEPSSQTAVIGMPTRALLEAGTRHAAEFRRLAKQLPSLDSALEVDDAALAQVLGDVPEGIAPLLALVDGARTIGHVIDDSPFDDCSTLRTLQQLYAEGVLNERVDVGPDPRRSAPRRSSPRASREPSASRAEATSMSSVPPRGQSLSGEPPVSQPTRFQEEVDSRGPETPRQTVAKGSKTRGADAAERARFSSAPPESWDPESPREPASRALSSASRVPSTAGQPWTTKGLGQTRVAGTGPQFPLDPERDDVPVDSSTLPSDPVYGLHNSAHGRYGDPRRERARASRPSREVEVDSARPVFARRSDPDVEEGEVSGRFFSQPPSDLAPESLPPSSEEYDVGAAAQVSPERLERREKSRRIVMGLVGFLGAVALFALVGPALFGKKAPAASASASAAALPAVPAATASAAATTSASAGTAPVAPAPSAVPSSSSSASAGESDSPDDPFPGEELPDVPDPLKEAERTLSVGDFKKATSFSKAAIRKDPTNADGYFFLYTAFSETGKVAEARSILAACSERATKGQYKSYCPPKKR